MLKQLLSLLLCASLLAGMFAGCASGSGGEDAGAGSAGASADTTGEASGGASVNPEGFPIVDEPITLRFMAIRGSVFQNGYSEMEVFRNYEEESNIHIEWEEVAEEGWTERIKLTLAAGSNLPDAFYGGEIDSATVFKYAQQEMILPLNDLIENHTVNAKKYLALRDDVRKIITYQDGNIYSLPTIDESLSTRIPSLMHVNKTWLDRVGLEPPTTADEFYNMLKTFKEQDGNGNGVVGDEVCLTFMQYRTPNKVDPQKSMSNLFGLFGVADDDSHVMIQDDTVIHVPTSDGYREGVEFFHKLYAEGLLDPESFTQNESQMWSKTRSDEGVGATMAFTWLELNDGNSDMNEYIIIDPLEGQVVAKPVIVAGMGVNRFTITTSNPYPEATIRWIDTFLDNDVRALEVRFGKEGESWKWLDEDPDRFTELRESSTGATVDSAFISQFCPLWHAVQWELEDLWRKKQNTMQHFIDRANATNDVYINYAVQTWPGLSFDEDTFQEYSNIDTELRKYTDNMLSRFVLEGVTDELWAEYLEQCRQLGSERLTAIYQTRWDEYVAS